MAPEWFEEWFGEDYVQAYPHRDDSEAQRAVALIVESTGLQPGWRVLDVACGAGRHARAFHAAGAWCAGLDLSLTLLRLAQAKAMIPLVRADMRWLPVRARSMDLTVNLFTSFGYFASDDEHRLVVDGMAATVRPGGWLVMDFLNAETVRRTLVPHEIVTRQDSTLAITRAISPDGRFVRKTIAVANGREYLERVRLFEVDEIVAMLREAGVVVRHRFGDYDGGPLTETSPRVLLLGQVAS